MNWSKVLGVMGMAWVGAFSQSQPGDIAFTGFNADGNDDISFVALVDIPAGDTIRFCDSEWNGTGFGTDEGDFAWVSTSTVSAGTVVVINNLGSGVTTASTGTIPAALDNSGGMSTGGEAMFAFKGSAPRVVTTMLAAISNNTASEFGVLTGTGLAVGTTAIVLPSTTDMGAYNGPRAGLNKTGYLAALNVMANWLLEDTGVDDHNNSTPPDLPFSTAAFSLVTPLGPGDIAFTGFNADAGHGEGIAFVALKDIPANDTLRFCDSEWTGTAFGADEGVFSWVSNTVTPAGTVVRIDSIANGTTTASVGSIIPALDSSGGIGNSDEAMFVFKGPATRVPDTFLAAVATRATSLGSLVNTGLTAGSTAVVLRTDVDVAAYTGPRAGQNKAGYIAAIADTANWIFQDGSGNEALDATAPDVPFSSVAFTFGTAGADTVKPTVTNVAVTSATVLEITFSEPVDSTIAVNLSNYGINPVVAISAASYNKAQRKVTLTHVAFTTGTNYTLQVSGIKDTANNTMAAYTSAALVLNAPVPALSFAAAYYSRKENSGTLQIPISASIVPAGDTARVGVRIVAGGTAVAGTDFTFATTTFIWPKDSTGPRMLSVPIINNGTSQVDRFFVLELHNPTSATIGSTSRVSVYILDDDFQAPAGTGELNMAFVSSYKVDTTSGASAEIVAHDPLSQRLFVMNSTRDKLEILNFRNPHAISKVATIDLLAHGTGGTSVAFRNGIVAAAIDAANFQPGKVAFFDANGLFMKSVTVGSLPDMLTFTPDGRYVLVANEGQPSSDYLTDPEGSVSIIDMAGGIDSVSQARVTTAGFSAFNGQEAALRAGGGRIFGINATVAKDLEPEFIAVSEDSKTAWVTLQENNIIARLNLETKAFTNLFPLGMKDHSLPRNAMDVSDQMDSIFMSPWPVKGVYMPDAIEALKVGDTTYLFTANEGDAREYSALTEDIRVGATGYKLDSIKFPNAAILKLNTNIGRLSVSPATGDTDNDGDFDEIHVLGARSFSVWNGATGAQVWDSGDELERITAASPTYRSIFNASNDNATRKNRSDNKGPEPEGIALGKIGSKHYAFIALERIGGVAAYDVTDPRAPRYVTWGNNRTTASLGGDLGSEGIIFIPRARSPKDTAYVVLANEVSATVSVYSVRDTTPVSVRPGAQAASSFRVHHAANLLLFSRPVDFKLADARGRVLVSGRDAAWVDLAGLRRGRYFLTVAGEKAISIPLVR